MAEWHGDSDRLVIAQDIVDFEDIYDGKQPEEDALHKFKSASRYFSVPMGRIAVIGGTGELGRGLISHWVLAGERVVIGSRSKEKAERVARELSASTGRSIVGATNLEAARQADLIVLSVPFEGLEQIVEEIRPAIDPSKIVLSVIVPLKFSKEMVEYSPPPAGSAAEEVARLIPEAKVVSAFHTVGAKQLQQLGPVPCDVVICGDDEDAKRRVMELIRHIPGMRPIDGGPLRNSRLVESTVALLIELTRRYRVPGVSIRFEGI